MEVVEAWVGFDYVLRIGRVGRSGGLALLWNKNLNLHIASFLRNHIDVLFWNERGEDQ